MKIPRISTQRIHHKILLNFASRFCPNGKTMKTLGFDGNAHLLNLFNPKKLEGSI